MENNQKKIFISYSWAVKDRVMELSERLLANGVDVVIDIYDLKEGHDKYAFMEQSVNDTSVDKVLIICDKTYTEKVDNRQGGVGDETVIITPDIYGKVKQEKFIPIIFEVDEDGKPYCPIYLKSRIYFDLSTEEDRYEIEYEKLLRNIYEKPLNKKPMLGTKPEWLEPDVVDLSSIRDLIKQVRGYAKADTNKADYLLRKAMTQFTESALQYQMPEDIQKDEGLLKAIQQTKVYRDLVIDFCEALIYSSLPVASTLSNLLEELYNNTHDAKNIVQNQSINFELYDYMVWELLICVTAALLHFEKYHELYKLITHTYFLRIGNYSDSFESRTYFHFYSYSQTIENICKPKSKNPRLISLTGDILVEREKKPILTKKSIVNADLVLYQLGTVLNINQGYGEDWYPQSYVYRESEQLIWKKLISKEHCLKIAPILGCTTIDEIKELLSKPLINPIKNEGGSFRAIPTILSEVRLEKIATLI